MKNEYEGASDSSMRTANEQRLNEGRPVLPHQQDIFIGASVAAPELVDDEKIALREELLQGRIASHLSKNAFAHRLGLHPARLSVLENHGPHGFSTQALRSYTQALEGWAEPITGPAPLTPEEEEKQKEQRRRWRESAERWRRRHPEETRQKDRERLQTPERTIYQRTWKKSKYHDDIESSRKKARDDQRRWRQEHPEEAKQKERARSEYKRQWYERKRLEEQGDAQQPGCGEESS